MERLTRPGVAVDPTAARLMFMDSPAKVQNIHDRLLDLILNGPTLNGVNKDVLRQLLRQLYDGLKQYEDTGLTPEEAREACDLVARLNAAAKPLGDHPSGTKNHLLVKPCEVGDLLYEIDAPEYGVITCKVISMTYYSGPVGHVSGGEAVSDWAVEVVVVAGHGRGSSYNFEGDDFGNTVFLTLEAAQEKIAREAST